MAKKKTVRQKQKQLKRTRRDTMIRKLKKYGPLCVSKGFIEYANKHKWDSDLVDAGALVMHYYFMHLKRINRRGWMPIPYQVFEGMFGDDYKKIKELLLTSGFLVQNDVNYSAGNYCSEYMICDELRNNRISASHSLQNEMLQKLYIKRKEYWKSKKVKERLEIAAREIESAFTTGVDSYYWKVEKGYLTITQFETIKKLATNAISLKLSITGEDIFRIAKDRYNRKNPNARENYTFEAYLQRQQGAIDRTFEAGIAIDRNGRFYTPFTNISREYWDFITYKGKHLVGVDVGNSHVNCLLLLLKDIQINYFGIQGQHEDRVDNCQFCKQINKIPALVEHLHTSNIYYNQSHTNQIDYNYYSINTCKYNIPFITTYDTSSSTSINTSHTPNTQVPSISIILSPSFPTNPKFYPVYVSQNLTGFCQQTPIFLGPSGIFVAYSISLASQEVININPTAHSEIISQNLFFPSDGDISRIESMLDDDFYFRLMDEIGLVKGMTDEELKQRRTDFKGEFFHFLYRPAFGRYNEIEHWVDGECTITIEEDQVRKAFEKLLPSIIFFLDICKCRPGTLDPCYWANYHKYISRAMMSIESQIILETCANLWKQDSNMFLVTVHDCIKCLPRDVEKVKEELKRTFEKYHVTPQLDVKPHIKPDYNKDLYTHKGD